MDCLHDLLTILAILLLIMVSISSISPRCDYWVKMFILYMWYLFTSVLVIPIGLITRNPIISKYFLAFLYFLTHTAKIYIQTTATLQQKRCTLLLGTFFSGRPLSAVFSTTFFLYKIFSMRKIFSVSKNYIVNLLTLKIFYSKKDVGGTTN